MSLEIVVCCFCTRIPRLGIISCRSNGSFKSENHHRMTPVKNTLLASGWDFILYQTFHDFYIRQGLSFLGLSFLGLSFLVLLSGLSFLGLSFLGLSFLGLRS